MAKSGSGLKSMTPQVLRELCKKNNLYLTPKLNDVLYLHYQGFQEIGGLEEYTGLKCLWLECNAITELKGLDNQQELRCLFLQNNLIKKIENLHQCPQLDTLNLSHNQLRRVDNCTSDILPTLSTLTLSHNFIRTAGDIEDLTMCQTLSVLDLAHNKIDDILVVKIFARMPNLRVLTLVGNPIVGILPSYRKTIILECLHLTYLDTRPVFPRDRALAEAWRRGGYQAEKEENERWNREERRKMRENINRVLLRRNEIRNEQIELVTSSSDEEDLAQREELDVKINRFIQEVEASTRIIEPECSPDSPKIQEIIPDLMDAHESTESTEKECSMEVNVDSEGSTEDEPESIREVLFGEKVDEMINGNDNDLEDVGELDGNEDMPECKMNVAQTTEDTKATELIIPEIKEELAEETYNELSTVNDVQGDFPSSSSENHSQASQTPTPMISILSITLPPDSFISTPKHKIDIAPKYQKTTSPIVKRKSNEFRSTFDEFVESCEKHLQDEKAESERLFARYTEEVNKSFQEMLKETTDDSSHDIQDFEREIEEIGTKVQNLNEARMEQFREDSKEVRELIDGVFDKVSAGDEETNFRDDCKVITDKLEKLSVLIENPPVNQFDEMIEKFCAESTNAESWATDSKMKKIEKFFNSIEPSTNFSECTTNDDTIQIEDIEYPLSEHPGEDLQNLSQEVSNDEKREN